MEGRGLVHRIDRGTSGCLVVAKTNECHALLLSQFFLRNVRKSYQALVSPKQLLPDSGVVNAPIQGRPAESAYVVEERISSNLWKIRVTTTQGRKHQVRLHCSKGLKAPILLDPLYGGRAIMFKIKSPMLAQFCANQQICLHSDSLCIPDFGIDVKDPTPQWWQDLVDEISQR
jgi:23S rRNA pseudouridine1911/1915/1917 synthase